MSKVQLFESAYSHNGFKIDLISWNDEHLSLLMYSNSWFLLLLTTNSSLNQLIYCSITKKLHNLYEFSMCLHLNCQEYPQEVPLRLSEIILINFSFNRLSSSCFKILKRGCYSMKHRASVSSVARFNMVRVKSVNY